MRGTCELNSRTSHPESMTDCGQRRFPYRGVYPHLWLALLLAFTLAGCVVSYPPLPTDEPTLADAEPGDSEEQTASEPPSTTYGLEEEQGIYTIDDPWQLVEQAETAPAERVPEILLIAVAGFLDQQQTDAAGTTLQKLSAYPLSRPQALAFSALQAQLAARTGRHDRALSLLRMIDIQQVADPQLRRRILNIQAESRFALGRDADAMASLLMLEALLSGVERIDNQKNMLQLLMSMSSVQRALLPQVINDASLPGWVVLADSIAHARGLDHEQIFADWRETYPYHPALAQAVVTESEVAAAGQFRQIAVLLPLTSPFGNAAQAFYDGFTDARARDEVYPKPDVVPYDIGADPSLGVLYYNAAVSDGADFVVGPLGRKAVQALLGKKAPEVDTLVIADVPPPLESALLYGISLSPEQEAGQVARYAYRQGHRQATVFRIEGSWGDRVAGAFAEAWEALGGIVVKNSSFPKAIDDYSLIIRRYLGLDKSIARAALLEAQLGVDLKFTPRRNHDMDFIFLAANANQARLAVPQLRFFQAHNLPIYATSYVYTGVPEPAIDADLDGIVFGDMPWIIDITKAHWQQSDQQVPSQDTAPVGVENDPIGEHSSGDPATATSVPGTRVPVPRATSRSEPAALPRPYAETGLDRFYALGMQSYEMLPRMGAMRGHPFARFRGTAMTVHVDDNGQLIRHPLWSTFQRGYAIPYH